MDPLDEKLPDDDSKPTLEEIRQWQMEDEAWAAERMGLLDEPPVGEGEPDSWDNVIADDWSDYHRGLGL